MACPWDFVSPATRKAAGMGDVPPAPGAPFHMFNSRASEDFVRKLLKPGKTLPHGPLALGPRPLDLDNPHRPCRKLGAGLWSSLPDWFLRSHSSAGAQQRLLRREKGVFRRCHRLGILHYLQLSTGGWRTGTHGLSVRPPVATRHDHQPPQRGGPPGPGCHHLGPAWERVNPHLGGP